MMTNYTDYLDGRIKAKGFKWTHRRLLENFFVLISPGENFMRVNEIGGNIVTFTADQSEEISG